MGRLGGILFAGTFLGALLLVVAEFTTLYSERIASYHGPLTSVSTGSHDSYALIPIGLLALVLGFAVLRGGSRAALLAVGIAGVVALLIALVGDLPDAHSSGLVFGPSGQYVNAVTDPGAGMYLETLGAVVLIATAGCGFLMLGRPQPRRPVRSGGSRESQESQEPGGSGEPGRSGELRGSGGSGEPGRSPELRGSGGSGEPGRSPDAR
jgi:hypothetical protein